MEQLIQVDSNYIAGSCNIGPEELARRRMARNISGIVLVVLTGLVFYLQVAAFWGLVLFLPAIGFAVSFLQVRNKFCVAFGLSGVYNFDELGKLDKTITSAEKKLDQQKVFKMTVQSVLFAFIYAISSYFILRIIIYS
ncbi:MAG: hypothetical protein INQ03_14015 [Candidatus Heimdallarchaeota archaeon]|nr:hypothetical protein [Candidatus Heimdallarchaeota archaeon]